MIGFDILTIHLRKDILTKPSAEARRPPVRSRYRHCNKMKIHFCPISGFSIGMAGC
jgi:hypothetical protein